MTQSVNTSSGNFLTRIFGGLDLFGKKRRAGKEEADNIAAARKREQDRWDKVIPFTRGQVREILKRDLPSETEVYFDIPEKGNIKFHVEAHGLFKHERSCDFSTNTAPNGEMKVQRQQHGQRYGRTIMRNSIELYRACGIKKMEIVAGNEAGGYTWARVGFLPNSDSITPQLRSEIDYRWEKLESLMTEEEIKAAHKSDTSRSPLELRRPEDFWQIADIRTELGPRLRDVFKRATHDQKAARLAEDLENAYNFIKISLGSGTTRFDLQQEIGTTGSMTLGRMLLMGTEWPGYLDFNNEKQMARVENYVGGWKGVPAPARSAFTAGG